MGKSGGTKELKITQCLQTSDMGLRNSEKGGKWCGGLGAAVGPQWGLGATPGRGLWALPQEADVFSVCHHKKQHSGEWKSDICKSVSFMFRPDIYLVILKIALKMSFWCSKNKILAKVPNHLTATVSWDTSEKKKKLKIYIYSGTAAKYILVQVQHTFQPISNNQKKVTLHQRWEE